MKTPRHIFPPTKYTEIKTKYSLLSAFLIVKTKRLKKKKNSNSNKEKYD